MNICVNKHNNLYYTNVYENLLNNKLKNFK